MADAIVSAVAERIIGLIEEQARYHVNLVRGAKEKVRSLADELKTIRNVLDDAENRRFKENSVKDWLARLEQTSYEMEDVLDEWNYEIRKLQIEKDQKSVAASKQKVRSFIPSSPCFCFKKVVVRHRIAEKILVVKAQLDKILREKDQYSFVMSQPTADNSPHSWRIQSTSAIDFAKIHGRDSDRDILLSKLMANGEKSGIRILSIVGVGGLGKTTLAQLVYNDSEVKKSFDLSMWVCVSDPFDLAAIAKGILESIRKESTPTTTQLDVLLENVKESISGKMFLLVLDDVWNEDSNKWEPLENTLRCGGAGSVILVTTRKEAVAKIMGSTDDDIHRPGELSNEDCWLLLSRIALSGREKMEFEDIGKKIAGKCKGLPLAAKTLGSLLRFKNTLEEWENVLNSEIWQLEKAEVEIFPLLLLSYNELPPALKRCFSYCAVLPKDSKIDVRWLIGIWMAQGYLGSNGDLEGRGREYFDILAMHSLFQDFEKDNLEGKITSCKMHDIVHDFAQYIRKSSRPEAARMNKTTCGVCDYNLLNLTHVNEFCSLFLAYESPPNLSNCLTRLRAFSMIWCSMQSLPQGMDNLIHLRWLGFTGVTKLSGEDLKIIFQLYNLQTLILSQCDLEEIPSDIGNLIQLRHLDLSKNESLKEVTREIGNLVELRHLDLSQSKSLKELPREIGNLVQLRHLDLSMDESLKELPESICSFHEIQFLNIEGCRSLNRIPEGLAQLASLRELKGFHGGSGWSKLGLLKKLNNLGKSLELYIRLASDGLEELIEDAREAELRNKIHVKILKIRFVDDEKEDEWLLSARMDLINALEPHPKLQKLLIWNYRGSKLPLGWMVSPLNQLRELSVSNCSRLSSLPPFGKLLCLEELRFEVMRGLQYVGRELLGISSSGATAFPKLKKLTFWNIYNWKEWEDITAEEEEDSTVMPCLTHLVFHHCDSLTALPLRLLRKAASLQELVILYSTELKERYADKDGSHWKCISHNNPTLELRLG